MKTKYFLSTIIASFITVISFAQVKTTVQKDTIKVYGECGMCKSKIEKAAKTAGAVSAVWNDETKMLALKYDTKKTDAKKIQAKIAGVGYDTQDVTATDKAYESLPECCHYERKK